MQDITEQLVAFIWQKQYFQTKDLQTTDGTPIEIVHCGRQNIHQGADFVGARIRVEGVLFHGSVEIHVRSSDWHRHKHNETTHYRNTILHVVWQVDTVQVPGGIPVVELQHRTPRMMLSTYYNLLQKKSHIPCAEVYKQSPLPDPVFRQSMDTIYAFRKREQMGIFTHTLRRQKGYWEEAFFHRLAYAFGLTQNANGFEMMMQKTPLTVLAKHKSSLPQIEAMLFGQAGLLEGTFTDDYPRYLQKEYRYFAHAHGWTPQIYPIHYLRLRPMNFPTIRLAQLSMLYFREPNLCSATREATSLAQLRALYKQGVSFYWRSHFVFDKAHKTAQGKYIGDTLFTVLMINAILPFLYTYARHQQDDHTQRRADEFLRMLPAEDNITTRKFDGIFPASSNARDSQAQLFLYTQLCSQKKCLSCPIGQRLIGAKG